MHAYVYVFIYCIYTLKHIHLAFYHYFAMILFCNNIYSTIPILGCFIKHFNFSQKMKGKCIHTSRAWGQVWLSGTHISGHFIREHLSVTPLLSSSWGSYAVFVLICYYSTDCGLSLCLCPQCPLIHDNAKRPAFPSFSRFHPTPLLQLDLG